MTFTLDEQTSARTLARELASYQAITRRLNDYTQELEGEMQQTRTSLHLAQAVIDVLPDPVLIVERTCRIVQLNRAAATVLSLPPDAAGRALCPTALKCFRCFGDGCPLRQGAVAHERQLQLAGPEGDTSTYRVTAIPLPDTPDCVMLLFRDITDLVALIDGY